MQLRDSRVVVTGGAGFIGSHLVDTLLRHGSEVVVVDDFSTGDREKLAHVADNRRLHVEAASVLDEAGMRSLLKGAQFVFHLATRNVRLSLRQPTLVHEVNATGTLNVLKAAAAAGARRVLYCSSSEVNGTADVVPMQEDYLYRPETIYGASKLAGEYYAQVFQRAGWIETVIARPHNNYGPRGHYEGYLGEVIPRFILWALAGQPLVIFGDGSQTRDFTYVAETAELLVALLCCDSARGNVYNICRGEETSIREIARLVSELSGRAVPVEHRSGRPSDVLRLCGDPARLRNLLGKSPQVAIRQGLERTMDWFRDNIELTDSVLSALQVVNWDLPTAESWLAELAVRPGRTEAPGRGPLQ